MVSTEELRYLYWLGQEVWNGSDDVLEIGPWLGGSTWCLACGMEANQHRQSSARLHIVDTFRWRPFMSARAPIDLIPDESFRSHFEANLASKHELLCIHEARLPDDASSDLIHDDPVRTNASDISVFSGTDLEARIGIAFIDGAKSWQGLVYLLRELLPRRASHGLTLVLQDFKCWSPYWVPMCVGLLLARQPGALRLEHILPSNSVTFSVSQNLTKNIA